MAGHPGPRKARPEDMLHDPATQPARICGLNESLIRNRGSGYARSCVEFARPMA